MSDFRELNPSILHPPVREPVGSDGSPMTVIRDTQGQISEASGRGRDGVVRRLTVSSKSATNADGFHFIGMQLDLFENGKEYLRVGTIFSPDARESNFMAYSPTSRFGFAVGITPSQSQAIVVTTTGRRATVDLSRVSPRSALTHGPSFPALVSPGKDRSFFRRASKRL